VWASSPAFGSSRAWVCLTFYELARPLLKPVGFGNELDFIWFELWHHEGRRARHGASMMGPDFTHWHGMYEVAKHFYSEFVPELEALIEKGRRGLREHLVQKAMQARIKYGLCIDGEAITEALGDPEVVRHPTVVCFDDAPLRQGEFACVLPPGEGSDQGRRIVVHPHYQPQPDLWPLLIAYYIPDIHYGEVVTAAEAELYGATLLGLEVEEYYQALCELADGLPGRSTNPA
jgi:hypothetical protein